MLSDDIVSGNDVSMEVESTVISEATIDKGIRLVLGEQPISAETHKVKNARYTLLKAFMSKMVLALPFYISKAGW